MTELKFKAGDKIRRDDLYARSLGKHEMTGTVLASWRPIPETSSGGRMEPEWVTVRWDIRNGPGSRSDRLAEGLSLIERPTK